MFAYVVYDKLKDKLIIVNDIQGEKIYTFIRMKNILLFLQQ